MHVKPVSAHAGSTRAIHASCHSAVHANAHPHPNPHGSPSPSTLTARPHGSPSPSPSPSLSPSPLPSPSPLLYSHPHLHPHPRLHSHPHPGSRRCQTVHAGHGGCCGRRRGACPPASPSSTPTLTLILSPHPSPSPSSSALTHHPHLSPLTSHLSPSPSPITHHPHPGACQPVHRLVPRIGRHKRRKWRTEPNAKQRPTHTAACLGPAYPWSLFLPQPPQSRGWQLAEQRGQRGLTQRVAPIQPLLLAGPRGGEIPHAWATGRGSS